MIALKFAKAAEVKRLKCTRERKRERQLKPFEIAGCYRNSNMLSYAKEVKDQFLKMLRKAL